MSPAETSADPPVCLRYGDRVAATIPAYQAGPWVGEVVRDTLQQLPTVLVVDDGSDDDTSQYAREAGARVLRVPKNEGKGHALRLAFDDLFGLDFEAVITLDADGQHRADQIPRLLETWERTGADLVLGTRDHLYADMSAVRRFSNTLSSRLISSVAGRSMLDIQTGFRLYTRRLIDAVGFPEARFQAESAVVVRTLRRGFELATVPIELARVDGRSTSHYRPLVDSLRIARAVARARFERA
ncbi:MAG: glycosyltransferase family 2 protein [Thermoanaerobaculia bacterium]|nr:glycosyltransferase family 2 protein [Thermoanaerobaculia bacterium]